MLKRSQVLADSPMEGQPAGAGGHGKYERNQKLFCPLAMTVRITLRPGFAWAVVKQYRSVIPDSLGLQVDTACPYPLLGAQSGACGFLRQALHPPHLGLRIQPFHLEDEVPPPPVLCCPRCAASGKLQTLQMIRRVG